MTMQTAVTPFHFGLDYIREHFGSNIPLATQQITHNLYRENPERLVDQLIRCLALDGREDILDIGCGNGFILGEVASRLRDGGSAIGLDISAAMLKLAEQNTARSLVPVTLVEGRAEDLSAYADGRFDRVMANFIFHYIDDPHLVCSEIGRVMNPAGIGVVTIEARRSMPEMYDMHLSAMERCGFASEFIERLPRGRRGKMVLDNTLEVLTEHFREVVEHPYVDALTFSSPEPFMRFYSAGHRYLGAKAMGADEIPSEQFDALHQEVEAAVRDKIKESGRFVLNKQNSIFVCKHPQ